MIPIIATAPSEEPVTLTDIKLHLRVTASTEDTLLNSLITTARERCEEVSFRSLVTRTVDIYLSTWPIGGVIQLPMPPVQSITSVTYTDVDGATGTVSASSYYLATARGSLVLKPGASWPTAELQPVEGIKVRYVAGYGAAAAVPGWAKHAMRLLVAHWYMNREAITVGTVGHETPEGAMALLMANRAY